MWASRAAFVFKCWNYSQKVYYLIGGLNAWPGPTEQGPSTFAQEDVTTVDAKWQDQYYADYNRVRDIVSGKICGVQIVDSRPKESFDNGHIPGSVHVPLSSLLDAQTKVLKSPEEIKQTFADAKVDLQKPCVFTCGGGVMASTPLMLARQMYAGVDHRMYDGSFSEFSKRPLDDLEACLKNQKWIGGDQATSADREAFESMSIAPKQPVHPHVFNWYELCSKTDPAER